jgi:sentrin-specific protease 1
MKTRALTVTEDMCVDDIFTSTSWNVNKFGVTITHAHIQCLIPTGWLNDETINFYMDMLNERSMRRSADLTLPKQHRLSCRFFSTFFYKKLVGEKGGYKYANVLRWTKGKAAFEYDHCFVPIHVNNSHWCLANINFRNKCILYYDSLSGPDYGSLSQLLLYVRDECQNKSGPLFNSDDWTLQVVAPKLVPTQQNGYDCGVFTIKMAEYLGDGLSLSFDQSHTQLFRRRILFEINEHIIT